MYETLFLSVGRAPSWYSYEYVLYSGDYVVARESGFPSRSAAKRAGMKKADALLADPLPFA